MNPQVTGNLSDRATGPPDDADGTLLEQRIVLPA